MHRFTQLHSALNGCHLQSALGPVFALAALYTASLSAEFALERALSVRGVIRNATLARSLALPLPAPATFVRPSAAGLSDCRGPGRQTDGGGTPPNSRSSFALRMVSPPV